MFYLPQRDRAGCQPVGEPGLERLSNREPRGLSGRRHFRRGLTGTLLGAALALWPLGCATPDLASYAEKVVVTASHDGHSYRLYVPSGYRSGTPIPIVLMLHGCLQGAAQFAQTTRMDALAEAETFLALYPEQTTAANPVQCWLWYEPAHQERGSGEPAFFAGLLDKIRAGYTVDSQRIYVAGFSAGGAMATVLGAVYPDLFAAIVVNSGMEYKAATSATAAFPAMSSGGPAAPPQGRLAYRAMGPRARVVPTLVFHGSGDRTVHPNNGNLVLSQWATTNDLADNGAEDRSISDVAKETRSGSVTGGRTFTRSIYQDRSGQTVMEKYVVDGMAHAWSGGNSGSYGDPGGPDASRLAWEFFRARPLSGTPTPPDAGVDLGPVDAGVDLRVVDAAEPARDLASVPDAAADLASVDAGSTLTLSSIGSEDGTAGLLPIDGASATTHTIGDKGFFNSDSYRVILSFDTTRIPTGATIRGARLRIVRRSLVGKVKTLSLSIKNGSFGSSSSLLQEDYFALATQAGIATQSPPAADGQALEFTLPTAALSQINRAGRTQLRVNASTTPGFTPNQLLIFGGEDATNAPTLTVDY